MPCEGRKRDKSKQQKLCRYQSPVERALTSDVLSPVLICSIPAYFAQCPSWRVILIECEPSLSISADTAGAMRASPALAVEPVERSRLHYALLRHHRRLRGHEKVAAIRLNKGAMQKATKERQWVAVEPSLGRQTGSGHEDGTRAWRGR